MTASLLTSSLLTLREKFVLDATPRIAFQPQPQNQPLSRNSAADPPLSQKDTLALAAHNAMPGSGPRVDPSAYAANRQANIARAAELRAQRRAESGGGDSLDALTQDARPARKPRSYLRS